MEDVNENYTSYHHMVRYNIIWFGKFLAHPVHGMIVIQKEKIVPLIMLTKVTMSLWTIDT